MTLSTRTDSPIVSGPALFRNREISWLDFNQRVLDQAISDHHPLLERVKFLAIVGANLDEFFMVRVATLLKKQRAGLEESGPDGLTVAQRLTAIRQRAAVMLTDQAACWHDMLRPALAGYGIQFLERSDYSDRVRHYLTSYFRTDIFPLLTPLAFDPGHPFPVVSNRSKNFAVAVKHNRRTKFARVKVPAILPRFIRLPHARGDRSCSFAFLEDVIRENLGALFPGIEVIGAHLFRVIRDADVELRADDDEDLLESMDRQLKALRHGAPSLLQAESAMPRRVLKILIENFDVDDDIVVRSAERLDFSDWLALHKLQVPQLKDPPFVARTLWAQAHHDSCVFDDIRERDCLVHHPYDSFVAVETFLQQASTDPQVVGIKMTLYRIGANSPLIDLLIDAADAGKQVAVLVELKARFDERNNINWATRLESAGVHVVYGVENLKTHCKLCLVVRKETDGVRRYAHIGTGNYNRGTSQVYTDFGLFTADTVILDDISDLFNFLTGYSNRRDYQQLLVAPVGLRTRFIALLHREIEHARQGRAAHIILKNNAVTDPEIIHELYAASQAGVRIEMIVRGACCLRPGLEGISDRITVRSIVGRFLEHSRVYYFANGGQDDLYIGSADLMERNLDRRVEALCRISDDGIIRHIRDVVLGAYLRDNDRAYTLVDSEYTPATPAAGEPRMSAQDYLIEWYTTLARTQDEAERNA